MADQANDPQLERLELLWESDPSSKVYLELAEAYRETGRTEDAVRVLETSLQHRPRDPRGRVALARCRLDQRDTAAATELLEDVTRQDPAHVLANKLLLEAYLRDGDAAKAEERLNIYRLLNDRDPELDHLEYRLEGLRSNVAVTPAESAAEDASAKPTVGPAEPAEDPAEPAEDPAEPADDPAEAETGEQTPTEMVRALAAEAGASTSVVSEPATASSEPETIESADSPAFELAPIEPESESTEELETTEATAALQSGGGDSAETAAAQSDEDAASTESEPTAATEPVAEGTATPDGPTPESATSEGATTDGPSQDEEDLYRMTVDAGDEPTVALEPEPDPAAAGTPAFTPSAQESSGGTVFEMVDEADAGAAEAETFPESPAAATAPSSNDLFDLGPPAPAPDLDSLFDLGASPPPAPSLDDLWGAPAESTAEPEPVVEPEPVAAESEVVAAESEVVAAESEAVTAESEAVTPAEPEGDGEGEEPATVTLGELYLSQGHRDEAEKIFRRVLAEDPDNHAARAALEQLESAEAGAPELEPQASEAPVDEAGEPEAAAPEAGAPEAAAPEVQVSDAVVEVSEPAVPVVEAPEPVARESDVPVIEAPEPEAPEAEAPEAEAPELEAPEAEAPELEAPEAEAPEAEAPELDVPSTEDEPAEPVAATGVDTDAQAAGEIEPDQASEAPAEPVVEASVAETATTEAPAAESAAEAAESASAETADEAWPLAAPALLADRSLAGVVPEGLTAKKILVLNQYLQHLRTAARHHVR